MNILVTQDYDCKITDFGMSKLISDDIEIFNTANAGTPLWMAPEVKAGLYSFPADVYSTGLVLYEILELKLPPWDKSLDHITFPEKYQFQHIIEPLIRNDSTQRLSAKDALTHFDNQLVKVVVENIRKAYPDITVNESLEHGLLQSFEKQISSKNPNYDDLFKI